MLIGDDVEVGANTTIDRGALDDTVIEEKVWVVQQTIQSMVNRGLKERSGIFW